MDREEERERERERIKERRLDKRKEKNGAGEMAMLMTSSVILNLNHFLVFS